MSDTGPMMPVSNLEDQHSTSGRRGIYPLNEPPKDITIDAVRYKGILPVFKKLLFSKCGRKAVAILIQMRESVI